MTSNHRDRLEQLTEADMAFHWPKLAGCGFGTHQIRQIIQRLEQKGEGLHLVLQGLDHAEWALLHGQMHDKEGRAIKTPLNWVFSILAKQGYYPRPAGFISAQEQAELDAATEKKQMLAAREERIKAACAAWIETLTADERHRILETRAGSFRMPPEIVLRNHFRNHVWPNIQQDEQ